jgi:hypothetical protein
LLGRRAGQKGKLASARIRRSLSTSYYALFHFLLDETSNRLLGTHHDLRQRRRIFARVLTHSGMRGTFDKIRGATIDGTIGDFLRPSTVPVGPVRSPVFAQNMAKAFLDAQAKRNDADYDLNVPLSVSDARLLKARVEHAIAGWRSADSPSERDFKHALCMLLLLKGQLRKET